VALGIDSVILFNVVSPSIKLLHEKKYRMEQSIMLRNSSPVSLFLRTQDGETKSFIPFVTGSSRAGHFCLLVAGRNITCL
jgi:hypothetical protein